MYVIAIPSMYGARHRATRLYCGGKIKYAIMVDSGEIWTVMSKEVLRSCTVSTSDGGDASKRYAHAEVLDRCKSGGFSYI